MHGRRAEDRRRRGNNSVRRLISGGLFVSDLWVNSHSRRQNRASNTERDVALRPEKPRYEQIISNQNALNSYAEREHCPELSGIAAA
jgi:hypothetical protein